ncbi:NAD(P)/FAD-dependent oxidoreductase [Sphingomonas oryzagri]|uniref:NAD(P)/FAD-dependent oxidoreductase n=1 Tax=Sphingomonas oryzagri TaxID=3042314 RepID=A0ABT6N335_9SPHN|nr:NAD(P)/FAD-dependent oxidoreductase [Sphingomonas oryzagri]MDH7639168.1 NAD(P)/FAD-dependent oxidoreductase [Sphingomonas oryzagri]
MADTDVVVIGAGVIGLAIARRMAQSGLDVMVLEANSAIGMETSSRNSEVIHAGLYYAGLPLKSSLCIAGRKMLYDYCIQRDVPHRRIGKLIVAFSDRELQALEDIHRQACTAGVDDLEMLDRSRARDMEPELACASALYSPSTGIIDSHAYMLALLTDAEAAGAQLVKRTHVSALARSDTGDWRVFIEGEYDAVVSARFVVNAAGHGACELASRIEDLTPHLVPTRHFARGSYFLYHGRVPFSHLIYPVPVPGGLGTHLTLDMGGQARFGPDVEWIDSLDYSVDPNRADRFRAAAARFWPGFRADLLQPDYCGIRPKLGGAGAPASDFQIQGPDDHRLAGLVNLYGIESPGLTASLAIAEVVAARLGIAN